MIVKMTKTQKQVFLSACASFGIRQIAAATVYPHNVVNMFQYLRTKTSQPEMIEFADFIIRNAEICQQAEEPMTAVAVKKKIGFNR